jgi:hypothetical protein
LARNHKPVVRSAAAQAKALVISRQDWRLKTTRDSPSISALKILRCCISGRKACFPADFPFPWWVGANVPMAAVPQRSGPVEDALHRTAVHANFAADLSDGLTPEGAGRSRAYPITGIESLSRPRCPRHSVIRFQHHRKIRSVLIRNTVGPSVNRTIPRTCWWLRAPSHCHYSNGADR